MKTELVDVSETRKNLVVEIPTDKVDAEITRVTTRYSKQARLPGFRPGKVPAKVVLQRFKGQSSRMPPSTWSATPSRTPWPSTASSRSSSRHPGPQRPRGPAAHVHRHFDVVPAFDPGDLTEIELRKQPVVVDEDAVNQALERLRERAARFEPVDGWRSRRGTPSSSTWCVRAPTRMASRRRRTSTSRPPSKWAPPPTLPASTSELIGMAVGESNRSP